MLIMASGPEINCGDDGNILPNLHEMLGGVDCTIRVFQSCTVAHFLSIRLL